MAVKRKTMDGKGAYILYIQIEKPLKLGVGSLGDIHLPAGRYAYVGSARRGVAKRVARHRRLAGAKAGKFHWHIDYLLMNPHTRWIGDTMIEDGIECRISRRIASLPGVLAPVPGFGASDCRSGCEAHLYCLPDTPDTQHIRGLAKAIPPRKSIGSDTRIPK